MAYRYMQSHCKHCKGQANTPCKCTFGCPTKYMTKCFPFFEDKSCASCRTKGIKGSLYRCRTCANFDLCATCYSHKVHPEHAFMELERMGAKPKFHNPQASTQPPEHMSTPAPATSLPTLPVAPPLTQPLGPRHNSFSGGVAYQACAQNPLRHSLPAKPIHSVIVTCDKCHRDGTRYDRLKCATCPDFDLCVSCHTAGFHGDHPFLQFQGEDHDEPVVLHQPRQPQHGVVHERVCCDACGLHNIRGNRYRCAQCHDFDLCATCYDEKNTHVHHAFLCFATPGGEPRYCPATAPKGPSSSSTVLATVSTEVHSQISCEICGQADLIGVRYKCQKCPNWNLCSKCWDSGAHGSHPFWRFERPGSEPALVPARSVVRPTAPTESLLQCTPVSVNKPLSTVAQNTSVWSARVVAKGISVAIAINAACVTAMTCASSAMDTRFMANILFFGSIGLAHSQWPFSPNGPLIQPTKTKKIAMIATRLLIHLLTTLETQSTSIWSPPRTTSKDLIANHGVC